jgi:hypothetical protein
VSTRLQDYEACKLSMVEQGRKMADVSLRSRACIADNGNPFIRDGAVGDPRCARAAAAAGCCRRRRCCRRRGLRCVRGLTPPRRRRRC